MIQAFTSMVMEFLMMTFMMNSIILNNELIKTMMMHMMIMKLSIFPFHSWFMSLMTKLMSMECFMVFTIQKIIPMMLLMMINESSNKMMYLVTINLLFSSIMGMNQTMMKTILAFSSIFYTRWMIILMETETLGTKFLMIYLLITMKIFWIMSKLKTLSLNHLYQIKMNMKFN